MSDERPNLSGTDARGGEKRGTVRYVLIVSLVLAILVMGALVFSYR